MECGLWVSFQVSNSIKDQLNPLKDIVAFYNLKSNSNNFLHCY